MSQPFIVKPLVPFASGALLALALAGCSPSNTVNNAANQNSSASVPNKATDNSAVITGTDSTPTPNERKAQISTVWMPGEDDKLHSTPLPKAVLDEQKKFGNPTAALNYILKKSSRYYPPQTTVDNFHDDGKTVSVSLSNHFKNSQFWMKAGDTTVRLAVYALVNSASNASETPKPVILKADNNSISMLGEFDVSDALDPDRQLEAKAGGTSAATSGSKAGGQ